MTKRGSLLGRALRAGSLAVAAVGCDLGTNAGGPIPLTQITRLEAFYCTVRNAAVCVARGAPIPSGTLPPADEAFQVWVWHPGSNTTEWRLLSSLDSITVRDKLRLDSAGESFTLSGAPAKKYTIRVLIQGLTGYLAQDSLHWEFP